MKQDSIGGYTVQSQEAVTIEVQATKVGEFAVASLDGKTLDPIGNPPPLRYHFAADKPSGQDHFVVLFFHFPDSAPADAFYQVFCEGSAGGGKFSDFNIAKSDPVWNCSIQFRVA